MESSDKVLVYWPQEKQWSIVSESAIQENVVPGQRTKTKFQGKLYPSIIIAKDNTTALVKMEQSFKKFINKCLIEEAPEDIEKCIIQYINDNVQKSDGSTRKLTKGTAGDNIDVSDIKKMKQKRKQLEMEKVDAKNLQLNEIISTRKTMKSKYSSSSLPLPVGPAQQLPPASHVPALPSQQTQVLVSMNPETPLLPEAALQHVVLPSRQRTPPTSTVTSGSYLSLQPYFEDYLGTNTEKEFTSLKSSLLELENEKLRLENEKLKAENATLRQQITDTSLPVTPRKVTFLKSLVTRLETEQTVLKTPEQLFKRHCRKSLHASASPSQLTYESSSTLQSAEWDSQLTSELQLNVSPSQPSSECSRVNEWDKTVTETGVKKVQLVKGSNIYITQTKLSTALLVGTCPRKLVIQLLESFFTREQLSTGNATGKRKAYNSSTVTKPLNQLVLQSILEFVLIKFKNESGEPALNVASFNSIINSKCATARRGLKLE